VREANDAWLAADQDVQTSRPVLSPLHR